MKKTLILLVILALTSLSFGAYDLYGTNGYSKSFKTIALNNTGFVTVTTFTRTTSDSGLEAIFPQDSTIFLGHTHIIPSSETITFVFDLGDIYSTRTIFYNSTDTTWESTVTYPYQYWFSLCTVHPVIGTLDRLTSSTGYTFSDFSIRYRYWTEATTVSVTTSTAIIDDLWLRYSLELDSNSFYVLQYGKDDNATYHEAPFDVFWDSTEEFLKFRSGESSSYTNLRAGKILGSCLHSDTFLTLSQDSIYAGDSSGADYPKFQYGNVNIRNNPAGNSSINVNNYYDGTNWKYIDTGYSANIVFGDNGIDFSWDTSGIAGGSNGVTWIARIDSNGLKIKDIQSTTAFISNLTTDKITISSESTFVWTWYPMQAKAFSSGAVDVGEAMSLPTLNHYAAYYMPFSQFMGGTLTITSVLGIFSRSSTSGSISTTEYAWITQAWGGTETIISAVTSTKLCDINGVSRLDVLSANPVVIPSGNHLTTSQRYLRIKNIGISSGTTYVYALYVYGKLN
jgi:hypothetical protein